jgi:DNA-binding CsgD family transcriptional regulator
MGNRYRPQTVLTAREAIVFKWRLQGLTVKEVAARLRLSPHTVRHHIESIHVKFGAHSLQQASNAIRGGQCRHCWIAIIARFTRPRRA